MVFGVVRRGVLAGVVGAALVAVAPAASAAAQHCSDWGPGGVWPADLKVCASASDGKITGKGQTRKTANGAVVWIQAVNLSTGKKYGTHAGKTLSVKVPKGKYQVDFYRGDGKGVVRTPAFKV
ncbi:hypothetical protein [Allokutzneria albata]|uniref:Carboxypeptidase regulatory-like domain-containing protein n=1 Tax=Allokutzneria albata TaxID=211114 RepID=A0A1H0B4X7_ALLAB|nr:hypothetical protein [Allokutzneria albata]SDN40656.1 hypothetical protein SAMN04489726_6475 [Allokutzneria albata]